MVLCHVPRGLFAVKSSASVNTAEPMASKHLTPYTRLGVCSLLHFPSFFLRLTISYQAMCQPRSRATVASALVHLTGRVIAIAVSILPRAYSLKNHTSPMLIERELVKLIAVVPRLSQLG